MYRIHVDVGRIFIYNVVEQFYYSLSPSCTRRMVLPWKVHGHRSFGTSIVRNYVFFKKRILQRVGAVNLLCFVWRSEATGAPISVLIKIAILVPQLTARTL